MPPPARRRWYQSAAHCKKYRTLQVINSAFSLIFLPVSPAHWVKISAEFLQLFFFFFPMSAPARLDDFAIMNKSPSITKKKRRYVILLQILFFFFLNAPLTLNPLASVLSVRRDLSLSITRVKDTETCSKLYRRIPSAVRHPVLKSNTSPFFSWILGHQPLSPPPPHTPLTCTPENCYPSTSLSR